MVLAFDLGGVPALELEGMPSALERITMEV